MIGKIKLGIDGNCSKFEPPEGKDDRTLLELTDAGTTDGINDGSQVSSNDGSELCSELGSKDGEADGANDDGMLLGLQLISMLGARWC